MMVKIGEKVTKNERNTLFVDNETLEHLHYNLSMH